MRLIQCDKPQDVSQAAWHWSYSAGLGKLWSITARPSSRFESCIYHSAQKWFVIPRVIMYMIAFDLTCSDIFLAIGGE